MCSSVAICKLAMGKAAARAEFLLSKRSQRRIIRNRVNQILNSGQKLTTNLIEPELVQTNAEFTDPVSPQVSQLNTSETNNYIQNSVSFKNLQTEHFTPQTEESDSGTSDNYPEVDIQKLLCEWNLKNNITRSALTDLLKLLKLHNCFQNFPSDSRTLLQTPRKTIPTSIDKGQYLHIGILNSLNRIISRANLSSNNELELQFNIDGLPIFRSSNVQLWPILGHVINTSQVFTVGIFCGEQKPQDLNAYLTEFVQDLAQLISTGFNCGNKTYRCKVKSLICDAPARSFICATKNHTGYYGCGKCEVKGKYLENRVVFLKTNSSLRTDSSFRSKSQPLHHNGDTILQNIPFDLVRDIPFEYMHLVCLGVTKKLLKLWVDGKRRSCRLRRKVIESISERLVHLKSDIPCEFARKTRSLREIDRWKATEFRTFLLYTGPIVLRRQLEEKFYNHFLVLSVAIRILAEPQQSAENIQYAESLLLYFVQEFKILYGSENVSYNVHGLIHLANDVRCHGALDEFSAFKFENYLGQLKRLIRSRNIPLQQIHRRIIERDSLQADFKSQEVTNPKVIEFNGFVVKPTHPNNVVLLKNGDIVQVETIYNHYSEPSFSGTKFKKLMSFFNHPCDSPFIMEALTKNIRTKSQANRKDLKKAVELGLKQAADRVTQRLKPKAGAIISDTTSSSSQN